MPASDSKRINRAVEKANSDPDFVDYAVGQLAGLQFPEFKRHIIEYSRSINADEDVIALVESLNGYMKFRDQYHVHKALQESVTARKKRSR